MRLARIAALAVGLWVGHAALHVVGAAVETGSLPAPAPATRLRIFVPAMPSADRALLEADAQLLAELAVAEDPLAVAAVTWVVVNRSRASSRPLLAEVVAHRQFGTRIRGRWFASWPRTSRWRKAHALKVAAALEVVRLVLGGQLPDPTGGATAFHRLGTWTPPWAPGPTRWKVLGRHSFYRLNRQDGR